VGCRPRRDGSFSVILIDIVPRVTSALHGRLIFGRRVQALADNIAELIPAGVSTLLDVGCGDGTLAGAIAKRRPALGIVGVEVHARPHTAIPVTEFDGRRLPFADASFDVVMLVDVLHHAEDPGILIAEARRVAGRAVIIKDHLTDAWLSHARLRLMDWVGNIGHGVPLRYAYWSRREWSDAFRTVGLLEVDRRENLGLYGPMLRLLFERRLHFVSCLVPEGV
jgi:SAM-dependent methyltransferase